MLVSEIRLRFNTLWQEYNSGYIPDSRLNQIFAHAQANYWEPLINKYQLDLAVTSEVTPLILQTPVSLIADNYLPISSLSNFKRFLTAFVVYTVDGTTYSKWTKELYTEELIARYSQGSYRHPRHRFIFDTVIITPSSPAATDVVALYIRSPYVIDFTTPSTDIPYLDVSIRGIVDEALAIAAKMNREDPFYIQSEAEVKQNSN